jgi:hypothetical protein
VAPRPGTKEAAMEWWVWVIIAVAVLIVLTLVAALVQRRRRRGGVIGLGDTGGIGKP